MTKICLRCFVEGKVQGVWFRANTKDMALRLQLTGWAKNLDDGRVEVMACGRESNVLKLEEWLWQGPEKAQVKEVISEQLDWQALENFMIL
jgi:acylphosphatase